MGVEGFCGLWGSGKTYCLALEGLRGIEQGRRVVANFHLDGAGYIDLSKGVEQLLALEAGELLLIDEVNVVLPSRVWAKAPAEMLYFWSQGRKRGLDVRWSSQSLRRVDVVLREVTAVVHECQPLRVFGKTLGFVVDTYEPEDVLASDATKEKKRHARHLHFYRKRIGGSYDTLERVAPSKHLVPPAAGQGRAGDP